MIVPWFYYGNVEYIKCTGYSKKESCLQSTFTELVCFCCIVLYLSINQANLINTQIKKVFFHIFVS